MGNPYAISEVKVEIIVIIGYQNHHYLIIKNTDSDEVLPLRV